MSAAMHAPSRFDLVPPPWVYLSSFQCTLPSDSKTSERHPETNRKGLTISAFCWHRFLVRAASTNGLSIGLGSGLIRIEFEKRSGPTLTPIVRGGLLFQRRGVIQGE